MSDDSDQLQHKERKSQGGCLILGLFVLLVGYVLSPPVLGLLLYFLPEWMIDPLDLMFEIVYYPLQLAYDNFEFVEAFYDWYLGLFEWL